MCVVLDRSFHRGGEVYPGEHPGTSQGQMAVSPLWEKIQGARFRTQAHTEQTC